MLSRLIILPILYTLSVTNSFCQGEKQNPKVLVVSFDGFRKLYYSNSSAHLPWFKHFASTGVVSTMVQSVFPSKTFVNHWSIVTGMYAESHGIVANRFYDPNLNKSFSVSSVEPEFWNAAEPIWQTARKQGKKTAVLFWPGSQTKYENADQTPNYYYPVYEKTKPFETRIEDAVNHLANDGADLAFLYFHEPDGAGHARGPDSREVKVQLERMDWYLSQIVLSLQIANINADEINVILCADHGMEAPEEMLYLDEFVQMADVLRVPSWGAIMTVQPKPDKIEEVLEDLKSAANKSGFFQAYLKKDLPERFHYSNNARIPDIVIVCELGYVISAKSRASQVSLRGGEHGYDPENEEMKPIFMARGPAFKKGFQVQHTFETKDIYAIISHLVGIDPRPTNASFAKVQEIFSNSSPFCRLNNPMLLVLLLFLCIWRLN